MPDIIVELYGILYVHRLLKFKEYNQGRHLRNRDYTFVGSYISSYMCQSPA